MLLLPHWNFKPRLAHTAKQCLKRKNIYILNTETLNQSGGNKFMCKLTIMLFFLLFLLNWCWCTLFIFNKCFANWNSYYHLCSDCIFYSQQTIRRGLTMSELYIYVVVPLFLNFAGKLLRKWDSFCLSTIKKKKKKTWHKICAKCKHTNFKVNNKNVHQSNLCDRICHNQNKHFWYWTTYLLTFQK